MLELRVVPAGVCWQPELVAVRQQHCTVSSSGPARLHLLHLLLGVTSDGPLRNPPPSSCSPQAGSGCTVRSAPGSAALCLPPLPSCDLQPCSFLCTCRPRVAVRAHTAVLLQLPTAWVFLGLSTKTKEPLEIQTALCCLLSLTAEGLHMLAAAPGCVLCAALGLFFHVLQSLGFLFLPWKRRGLSLSPSSPGCFWLPGAGQRLRSAG